MGSLRPATVAGSCPAPAGGPPGGHSVQGQVAATGCTLAALFPVSMLPGEALKWPRPKVLVLTAVIVMVVAGAAGLAAFVLASGTAGPSRTGRAALAASGRHSVRAHSSPRPVRLRFPRRADGRYFDRAEAGSLASQRAHDIGPGPVTIISARLETVRAASQSVGNRVAPLTISPGRMIWLVWVIGPWQPGCITTSCALVPHQLYFMALDASTGRSYAFGTSATARPR